jgi:hypothetical protein
VVRCGGADLMLRFQLERGGDGTKRCRKMKQRQRARIGSMRMKRDMTHRPEERRHWRGKGKR